MRKALLLTAPALGLIVPEVWTDFFSQFRQHPYWPWFQWACVAWIVLVVLASIPWPKRKRAPFALRFAPGELPYEELQHGVTTITNSSLASVGSSSAQVAWTQKVYRVRVQNVTDQTIRDCALHLERFDPAVPMLNDLPLHQMHDNPDNTSQFRRTFTLAPRGYQDVDVVYANSLHHVASLFHVVFNLSQAIGVGRHEIVLRAFATDVAPRYWRFVIVVKADGALDFRPSSAQKLTSDTGAKTPEQAA
jgi:hypothetical protein